MLGVLINTLKQVQIPYTNNEDDWYVKEADMDLHFCNLFNLLDDDTLTWWGWKRFLYKFFLYLATSLYCVIVWMEGLYLWMWRAREKLPSYPELQWPGLYSLPTFSSNWICKVEVRPSLPFLTCSQILLYYFTQDFFLYMCLLLGFFSYSSSVSSKGWIDLIFQVM